MLLSIPSSPLQRTGRMPRHFNAKARLDFNCRRSGGLDRWSQILCYTLTHENGSGWNGPLEDDFPLTGGPIHFHGTCLSECTCVFVFVCTILQLNKCLLRFNVRYNPLMVALVLKHTFVSSCAASLTCIDIGMFFVCCCFFLSQLFRNML